MPPFDDVNVRKAVVAAADRTALRNKRGGELVGPVATHFIPPGSPASRRRAASRATRVRLPRRTRTATWSWPPTYMKKAGYESGKCEGDAEITMVGDDAGAGKETADVSSRTARGARAST